MGLADEVPLQNQVQAMPLPGHQRRRREESRLRWPCSNRAGQAFVNRGRRALLTVMLTGDGTATADAVRDLVTLPPGIDAKLFGTVPHRLAYDRHYPQRRPGEDGSGRGAWPLR